MSARSTEPRSTPVPSGRTWQTIRIVFGLAGLTFAVLAIQGAWSEVNVMSWSPLVTVAATALVMVTTLMGARVWAALRETPKARSRASYYSALVGKYIPGGIFQAVGQVGYAARDGATIRGATKALALSMVTTGSAGLVLAGSAALVPSFPTGLRIPSVFAFATGLVLVRRGVLDSLTRKALARARKQPSATWLPTQSDLVKSASWALVGLAVLAASFTLVAQQIAGNIPFGVAFAAFAVAWFAGFVALPFPAGIGVREAVLVWLLTPWAAAGTVVAISLGHRLITVLGETIVYLASRRSAAARIGRKHDI